MGVWQPHHGGRHNHHAISLQPNCMMLGWHAQHQVQGILMPGCTSGPSLGTPLLQPHSDTNPKTCLLVKQPLIAAVLHRGKEQQVGWGGSSSRWNASIASDTCTLYYSYCKQHSCYKA